MGNRPKRNIILFLVEGKSDREALRDSIQELYYRIDENNEVFFPIIREDETERGGDITSRIGVHPRNIEEKIYEYFLKDFFDENKIYPKDISEIIQIVDTDGVYIPDDAVCEGVNPTGKEKLFYETKTITCPNASRVIKRNECKRENLDYLSSLNSIKVKQKSPRYSVYYFSCNLDHFLHNSPNLEPQKKRFLADIFAKNYIDDSQGFVNVISGDPSAVMGMNYVESWAYIREGLNSLQRHTNLNILLDKLISKEDE